MEGCPAKGLSRVIFERWYCFRGLPLSFLHEIYVPAAASDEFNFFSSPLLCDFLNFSVTGQKRATRRVCACEREEVWCMQRVTHRPRCSSVGTCDLRGRHNSDYRFCLQHSKRFLVTSVFGGRVHTSRWSRQTLQTRRALPAAAQVAS